MDFKINQKLIKKILECNTCPDTVSLPYEADGETIPVTLKNTLNLIDIKKFIYRVVNGCFLENEYLPEHKDVMFFYAVLETLSNIPIPTKKGETGEAVPDILKLQKWMEQLCLTDKITAMECSQKEEERKLYQLVSHLRQLTDDKIEFEKQVILSKYQNPYYNMNRLLEEYAKKLGDSLLENMNSHIKEDSNAPAAENK